MVRKIEGQYIKDMVRKHNAILFGTGGGMMNDIDHIYVGFQMTKELTIDEARELLVESIDDLLQRINSAEELRPYLNHYPYSARGVSVQLMFVSKPHVPALSPYVAGALACNGMMIFMNYDSEIDDFVEVHRESYEEAVEIVRGRKAA
jgi:hypothetical protein